MNGDGFADYLVVDGNTGSVTCYWNYGADSSAEHGWRFVPGGVIASGIPHANLATLKFPDINGGLSLLDIYLKDRADGYKVTAERTMSSLAKAAHLGCGLTLASQVLRMSCSLLKEVSHQAPHQISQTSSLLMCVIKVPFAPPADIFQVDGDGRDDYLIWCVG